MYNTPENEFNGDGKIFKLQRVEMIVHDLYMICNFFSTQTSVMMSIGGKSARDCTYKMMDRYLNAWTKTQVDFMYNIISPIMHISHVTAFPPLSYRCMTNRLMSLFNISGGGLRNKRAFGQTALYRVILGRLEPITGQEALYLQGVGLFASLPLATLSIVHNRLLGLVDAEVIFQAALY